MKPDYQRFFLTELVALIQQKYKITFYNFIYENKREIIITKPHFSFDIYTPEQVKTYNCVFVLEIYFMKITRSLY